jgi:hypothetical protein
MSKCPRGVPQGFGNANISTTATHSFLFQTMVEKKRSRETVECIEKKKSIGWLFFSVLVSSYYHHYHHHHHHQSHYRKLPSLQSDAQASSAGYFRRVLDAVRSNQLRIRIGHVVVVGVLGVPVVEELTILLLSMAVVVVVISERAGVGMHGVTVEVKTWVVGAMTLAIPRTLVLVSVPMEYLFVHVRV